MKILNIFGQMMRGGAEMRTIDIMRRLDPDEFCLHFCALSGLPGELDATIRSLNGKVHYVDFYNPMFSYKFYRLLKQEQYDIVHSHVHHTSGFISFLAARAGVHGRIAHFRSSHDGHSNSLRRQAQRGLMKGLIDRYATNILAVSETAMNGSWKADWRSDLRCQVIYNGIDLELFYSVVDNPPDSLDVELPDPSTLFIHVGRFDPVKNHQRLLAIFAHIASEDSNAHLLLVGQGGNKVEQLAREFVEQHGLHDRVTFTGVRSDVPRLISKADMMIFPSQWEGLPGAVLEACAAGRPVLASDIPVIREIAGHLPSLRCLPLDSSDNIWSNKAREICSQSKLPAVRSHAKQAFKDSPFTIQTAVRQHKTVWQGVPL